MSDMACRATAAATGFEMKDVCSSLANCFRHLQRGDVVSWNEVLRLSVTPQDIAAAVHQEGREVLEVSLLAHGRDILAHGHASRLLASCELRFLHMDERTRVFAPLVPAAGKVSATPSGSLFRLKDFR